MKVLIVESDAGTSNKVAESVRSAGHEVYTTAGASAAKAVFAVKPFHVAVIGARAVDQSLLDLLRSIRESEHVRKAYVLTLIGDASEDRLLQVYDAGADAHLDGRFSAPAMLARLRAAERLLQAHGVLPATRLPTAPIGTAPPAVSPNATDAIEASARSNTWCGARAAIEQAATKMLQRPATWRDVGQAAQPFRYATRIALIAAGAKVELRIALGMDEHSGRVLATHLFGDANDDLASDLLGELNNLFMGTMKAGLNGEGLGFTAGLPQAIRPDEVLKPDPIYMHQLAFSLRLGEATVAVHLSLCAKADERLVRARLCEGMVLAKDILNERGVLLLAGGTRLSQTMIEKLASMVPPNRTIDILAP